MRVIFVVRFSLPNPRGLPRVPLCMPWALPSQHVCPRPQQPPQPHMDRCPPWSCTETSQDCPQVPTRRQPPPPARITPEKIPGPPMPRLGPPPTPQGLSHLNRQVTPHISHHQNSHIWHLITISFLFVL